MSSNISMRLFTRRKRREFHSRQGTFSNKAFEGLLTKAAKEIYAQAFLDENPCDATIRIDPQTLSQRMTVMMGHANSWIRVYPYGWWKERPGYWMYGHITDAGHWSSQGYAKDLPDGPAVRKLYTYIDEGNEAADAR